MIKTSLNTSKLIIGMSKIYLVAYLTLFLQISGILDLILPFYSRDRQIEEYLDVNQNDYVNDKEYKNDETVEDTK